MSSEFQSRGRGETKCMGVAYSLVYLSLITFIICESHIKRISLSHPSSAPVKVPGKFCASWKFTPKNINNNMNIFHFRVLFCFLNLPFQIKLVAKVASFFCIYLNDTRGAQLCINFDHSKFVENQFLLLYKLCAKIIPALSAK